ncbi:hypothetical protein S83_031935, partial [Arachis hypogaea]
MLQMLLMICLIKILFMTCLEMLLGTDMHWANEVSLESDEDIDGVERVMPDVSDVAEFEELASHAELPLYEGCIRYSRLSFLVKMYHIICGMTDKAISMIFELLHDAFEH